MIELTKARSVKSVLLIGFMMSCILPAVGARMDQGEPGLSGQSVGLIYSVKGQDLFQAYCASCHGASGRGAGPVAAALKTKPPDLTLLAEKNGGQFPRMKVRSTIAGDEVLASHGSREMPIWGPIFHQIEEDQDFGNVRMENLVKYLESIQVATPSRPTSGTELYRQDCAVCHGNDLRGGGSVPAPYRTPPDLTTLARRHGKFPRSYVLDVLRNGVAMPAHGPAEMPIWGADFRLGEQLSETEIKSRIAALTGYIESHQGK
jgi:mono/diheme cytochrome c family protein